MIQFKLDGFVKSIEHLTTMSSQWITAGGTWTQFVLLLLMLTLIIWLKCLPAFSTVKLCFFSFGTISKMQDIQWCHVDILFTINFNPLGPLIIFAWMSYYCTIIILKYLLYLFSRTAKTKFHRLGGLNMVNLFSHSPGGRFVFSWNLNPWLAGGHLLTISSHNRSSVCISYVPISSSYKVTSHIQLRPNLRVPMKLYFFKGPISKYNDILGFWGFGI